jgi:K+-transporting ATPase ATPase C chain
MKENLKTAALMTLVTTLIFGVIYPLGVTGTAQLLFPARANGSLIRINGRLVGSELLGQAFAAPQYFHSRPSGAGTGYLASQSGATNLGPTNHQLADRVKADVEKLHAENPNAAIPVDLVTVSASGLDPEISVAAAQFQLIRVARARELTEGEVQALVNKHTLRRQFGFLGEPRVRVLELNLDLDATHPVPPR